MKLLEAHDVKAYLEGEVTHSAAAVYLTSAFIKADVLEHLFKTYKSVGFRDFNRLKVLARWRADDLCSGASDLEAYETCVRHGVKFYMKSNFHGKMYVNFPNSCVIGSSNLTRSGLSLDKLGNYELSVKLQNFELLQDQVKRLFDESTLISEELFNSIKSYVKKNTIKNVKLDWSEQIRQQIEFSRKTNIFVSDFLFTKDLNELVNSPKHKSEVVHDLNLLGLSSSFERGDVSFLEFSQLKCYRWLVEELESSNVPVGFGELSARLHDQLFDDPRPYRKTVKTLIQNLLNWSSEFEQSEVKLSRPNYSQVISLK